MTAVLAAPVISGRDAVSVDTLRRAVPGLLVGLAVAYTTMPFAQSTGGRGPWALTKAAVVVVAALVAVKPWRHLRSGVLILASAVSVAALLVCLVTPPGMFGINRAASYGLAAATFVTVAAYARRVQRVRALAAVVAVAGAVQFFWSFIPWWGGRQSTVPMSGTFYWHNQFGGFLLAPALIGLCLLISHRSIWRMVGWITMPFAVAGIVYSTSRGSLLVLAVGWLVVGALALRVVRSNPKAFVRWLGGSALAAFVTVGVAGPPFFPTSHAPWAAVQARSATGETATQNTGARVYYWRESVTVFEHHPLTGVGYGALAASASELTPAAWPHSPLSHNDYLQALPDGGLLLGIPFIGACAGVGIALLRALRHRVRRRVIDVRTGVTIGALAMMAHSAIDFDWSYPALFTTAAVVTALATAPLLRRPPQAVSRRSDEPSLDDPRPHGMRLRAAVVAVLVLVVLVGAGAGRRGGVRLAYHPAAKVTAQPAQPAGLATNGPVTSGDPILGTAGR